LFRGSERWRERLTVAAGHGLDEDLHRLLGLGAGRADAADAGRAAHDGGCVENGRGCGEERVIREKERERRACEANVRGDLVG
jgi:hypothetical protein